MLGLVFISLFCLLFPSIFSAILIDPRLLSKFYLLGYYFSMAQIKESVVKLNSTGKVALGSIATLANNLQYLKSIKDSGVFHQADYSTIQMGFTSTAKHLEQLWDEVDEEVLAGAVLIPQRPDPALNSSSATNSNSNVNANNNSNVNTSTALYPIPQLLSTFVGKDEQGAIIQPDPEAFRDNPHDRDRVLAHNEAIDSILDQLQDTIEDTKEAIRLRQLEEARAAAVKKQKL